MKELIKYLLIFTANAILIFQDLKLIDMYYVFDFKNTFLLVIYILLVQLTIYVNYIALRVNYKEINKLYERIKL